MNKIDFKKVLQTRGCRVTAGRLSMLFVLANSIQPLSVHEIVNKVSPQLDIVTVYRALDAFVKIGLVRRVDLHQAHINYEFIHDDSHSHHLICNHCGLVERINMNDDKKLENSVLKKAKNFTAIKGHSLEFFGVCNKCSHKV